MHQFGTYVFVSSVKYSRANIAKSPNIALMKHMPETQAYTINKMQYVFQNIIYMNLNLK